MSHSVKMGSRPDFFEPFPAFFSPPTPYTEYQYACFVREEEDVDPWSEDYIPAGSYAPTYNTECFCECCGYGLADDEEEFCECCRAEMWKERARDAHDNKW